MQASAHSVFHAECARVLRKTGKILFPVWIFSVPFPFGCGTFFYLSIPFYDSLFPSPGIPVFWRRTGNSKRTLLPREKTVQAPYLFFPTPPSLRRKQTNAFFRIESNASDPTASNPAFHTGAAHSIFRFCRDDFICLSPCHFMTLLSFFLKKTKKYLNIDI